MPNLNAFVDRILDESEEDHAERLSVRLAKTRAKRDEAGDIDFLGARGRLDAGVGEQGAGSTPSVFRLCRSILRRWPKAASVTRCSATASHGSGSGARHQPHHRRRHLGRRHESLRRNVEQDLGLGAPAGQHGEPAIGSSPTRAHDALGDFALEHQHHHSYQGGHGSVVSQPISSAVPIL